MHKTMDRSPQSLTIFKALVSKLSASEVAAAVEAISAKRHTNLNMARDGYFLFCIIFFLNASHKHSTLLR